MKIGFAPQPWIRDGNIHNFYRMLDDMALIGLDGFEGNHPFLLDRYERQTGEFRELLAIHDLELASFYASITFLDPDLRQRGIEEAKRRYRFAAEVGSLCALLDGGRKRPGISPAELDDQIKVIAESANMLGEYARFCGLTLGWHQHWGSIFDVEDNFHQLMDLTDPALVGFCPDVGQLALSGINEVETVGRYADRVTFVHYKDVTFAGRPLGELWPGGPVAPADGGAYGIDSRARWVELGRGVVDFVGVTEVLHSVNYDGWIVDDFDFTGYPARASAQACKDYINQALGIWGERDIRRGLAPKE